MAKRLLLMLSAAALALLIGEGALSLFLGRSVRDSLSAPPAPVAAVREQHDEERFAAAASNPGPYRVHPDPRVGYVLKADAEFEFAGAPVHSDTLGLRRRPGPSAADPLRIVIAGDSVAFGQGVADDQTLAHRLELVLNEVRGAGAEPVECRTAALPGWNYRNAVNFVLDHLDELDPDLVLFLPVENDLDDTDGAFETGHRRNQPDPMAADPWLGVRANYAYLLTLGARLETAGTPLDERLAGPAVLLAGLSPESTTRLADCASTLDEFGQRLARRGAPLVVVGYWRHRLYLELRARLADRVPAFPLLEQMRPEDTLGHDPHPSAETIEAFAVWTAGELLRRGLVSGGDEASLPEVPGRLRDRRADPWELTRCERELDVMRNEDRAALRRTVSDVTGEGCRQIYGGMNADGTVGPRMLALLAPGGGTLRVEVEAIADQPGLLPVPVRVEVDGAEVGSFALTAPGPVAHEFEISGSERPVEVRLIAEHWGVVAIRGTSRVASFRFLSLER